VTFSAQIPQGEKETRRNEMASEQRREKMLGREECLL